MGGVENELQPYHPPDSAPLSIQSQIDRETIQQWLHECIGSV